MRSKRRLSQKVTAICALVIVAIFAYVFGFSQGQASVYTKAQNDQEFYKQVWGEK